MQCNPKRSGFNRFLINNSMSILANSMISFQKFAKLNNKIFCKKKIHIKYMIKDIEESDLAISVMEKQKSS